MDKPPLFCVAIMLTSPLEQFEIVILYPYTFRNLFDISFTNATIFIIIVLFFLTTLLDFAMYKPKFFPTIYQFLIERVFVFIVQILRQQIGSAGLKYVPLFIAIFLIILSSNIIGLIPFAFTPTSHLAFTLTLGLGCNLALVIIGFKEHGKKFLNLFVPKGGPSWLKPLIIMIEFLSYLLRTLSLSIRLFANMMAGHTLLHILASFATAFLNSGHIFVSVFPLILIIAVFFLEFGIAFLQAYVFVVILAIYLNDSYHPEH